MGELRGGKNLKGLCEAMGAGENMSMILTLAYYMGVQDGIDADLGDVAQLALGAIAAKEKLERLKKENPGAGDGECE